MVANDDRIDVKGVMTSEEWITGDRMNDFSARSTTCGREIGAVTSTGSWKKFELLEASEEWITGDVMNDFSAGIAMCGWATGAVTSTGG